MRELDKDGKLNGDVIDGILSQEKKEVDKVIINSAELEKYFGKDKSPREMKDKIISLLDDWKAKQPSELGKPEKKTDMEKRDRKSESFSAEMTYPSNFFIAPLVVFEALLFSLMICKKSVRIVFFTMFFTILL